MNLHHPFAVKSETGAHRALIYALPTYKCLNILYLLTFAEVGYLTQQITSSPHALWSTLIFTLLKQEK